PCGAGCACAMCPLFNGKFNLTNFSRYAKLAYPKMLCVLLVWRSFSARSKDLSFDSDSDRVNTLTPSGHHARVCAVVGGADHLTARVCGGRAVKHSSARSARFVAQ